MRSDGDVRLTAKYQEPPATVKAQVTNAVIRSMYGTGECWLRGTDNSCVSTICAVVRTRYTCRLQNVFQGIFHFCNLRMRSCVGQSNDHDPCVKYLFRSDGLKLREEEYSQHTIRLIPSQLMLDINRRLSLHDETNQTQPQKERRVCVFLLGGQLGLGIWAATPHRAPSRE